MLSISTINPRHMSPRTALVGSAEGEFLGVGLIFTLVFVAIAVVPLAIVWYVLSKG
jgi:hypothetical protein